MFISLAFSLFSRELTCQKLSTENDFYFHFPKTINRVAGVSELQNGNLPPKLTEILENTYRQENIPRQKTLSMLILFCYWKRIQNSGFNNLHFGSPRWLILIVPQQRLGILP